MCGFVPLGYRAVDRTLVVHDAEAQIVCTIFQLYLKYRAVVEKDIFGTKGPLSALNSIGPISGEKRHDRKRNPVA